MCLGGLFVPEAYITATRQYVAQANSWSLEELCLEVNVTTSQSAALDACSFGVTGEWGVWRPSPLSELLAHAPRAGLQAARLACSRCLVVLGRCSRPKVCGEVAAQEPELCRGSAPASRGQWARRAVPAPDRWTRPPPQV